MLTILAIGIGVGAIAIVGGIMNIFPHESYWLQWVMVGLGNIIFWGCLILWIQETVKNKRLKIFISFLDKKIIEGQKLMASNLESFCSSWGAKEEPLDDDIKKFEAQYKKWRKQIYAGCKEAFNDKKEVPFNGGEIPQLSRMRWRRNNDYRTSLKEDIQILKDFRILTHKEDVFKKLN
jgi:hypothetical protein